MDLFSDKNDVVRVARQILNRSGSARMISRQETLVLTTNMNLTFCTEQFEQISTSGWVKLRAKKDSLSANKKIANLALIDQYKLRPKEE